MVNLGQIFAIDLNVNADANCVVVHQFGLVCSNFHPKAEDRGLYSP